MRGPGGVRAGEQRHPHYSHVFIPAGRTEIRFHVI